MFFMAEPSLQHYFFYVFILCMCDLCILNKYRCSGSPEAWDPSGTGVTGSCGSLGTDAGGLDSCTPEEQLSQLLGHLSSPYTLHS